jgi:hypothetical protein
MTDNRTIATLADGYPQGNGAASQTGSNYGNHNPSPYSEESQRQVENEAAGSPAADPARLLLRELPQEELERLNRIWQGERDAVTCESLMQQRAAVAAQLEQLGRVHKRLSAELVNIEHQMAALWAAPLEEQ